MKEGKLILDFHMPVGWGLRQCIDRIAIDDRTQPKLTADQLRLKVLRHLRQAFKVKRTD